MIYSKRHHKNFQEDLPPEPVYSVSSDDRLMVDGIPLVAGDNVLLKGQSTMPNGVYTVRAESVQEICPDSVVLNEDEPEQFTYTAVAIIRKGNDLITYIDGVRASQLSIHDQDRDFAVEFWLKTPATKANE